MSKSSSSSKKKVSTISVDASSGPGPLLATTTGVILPAGKPFTLYTNAQNPKANENIISLETSIMRYQGATFGDSSHKDDLAANYAVGVYDRSTGLLTVREAPVLRIRSTVRAMEKRKADTSDDDLLGEGKAFVPGAYATARTALGETFGNRRRKAQIREAERGRVDLDALADGASAIASSINERSVGLPTPDAIREEIDEGRLLPPFNAATSITTEIYPIDGLVSEQELASVPENKLRRAETPEARKELLPFRHSDFINERLARACDTDNSPHIRQLFFLSALFQLLSSHKSAKTLENWKKAGLDGVSTRIFQGLTRRFLSPTPGAVDEDSTRYALTEDSRIRLLHHIIILALSIANYSLLVEDISKPTAMPKTRTIEHFRNVGCEIKALSKAERDASNLPAATLRLAKKATLSAPLKFPPPKFKRASK